jgi:integrase
MQRIISTSPFVEGDPLISKADENRRERVLSFDEETRLLAACQAPIVRTYNRGGKEVTAVFRNKRDILNALITVALDTAMRRGELLTLRWADIDFKTKQINNLSFNTKTATARPVGLTTRVLEKLSNLQLRSTQDLNDLVFGIENNFKKSFAGACLDAKITGLTFHDLRHTAITRMVQAGIPLAEVMKVSGHTQMSTFQRYVNPDVTAIQNIASRLEQFNRSSLDGPDSARANI